jgi:Flp pilus assembly protein TadB
MGRRERRRGERGELERKRTQRDWERPGAIVKGPPITVTCECGQKRELGYGERWDCESCGRSWDTGRIPADQYDQIRRLSLRFRAVPIAFGAVVALLAIFFTLTGNIPGVFFLLPTALVSWFVFLRPLHRRRYRRAIKTLPRWELRAD